MNPKHQTLNHDLKTLKHKPHTLHPEPYTTNTAGRRLGDALAAVWIVPQPQVCVRESERGESESERER